MFKQKELDKLAQVKSPDLCETNGQPDILDIIGKEVPPDYVVDKPNVLQSSEKKTTGDIFDILKSEVPPDYVDDSENNNAEKQNKLVVPSDSKVTVKQQTQIVENDLKSECNSNNDEKSKTLDSLKENLLKSFNLIAHYNDEDPDDSGNYIQIT